MRASIIAAAVFVLVASNVEAKEYSCQLENGKYVSVFAEQGKPPIYRYGTLAKTEITLPVPQKQNNNVFYGHQMFVAGASTYVRFKNGNYSYVVYDGEGRGWYFNGVIIYKDNNIISKKECKEPSSLNLGDIDKYTIKVDPYLETYIYAP
ncbi:hypothetical protein [Proteus hauseri]|uniref:Uncharacterized protein n=1 Tax=Proteus hauseri ATCC 700826 TaxID=1354271 RepID=A0AAJ3HQ85_PROHU|nr:hypothetical protein [Proteus hauseri]OAT45171.1 hypothetical protein M997_3203 [Proteus hauseri ATCC 700826]QAV22614.1 hypothetical protein PH4a_04355 [Proteus hauseri]